MKEKIRSPEIREVQLRKTVAKHPGDLKAWAQLFNVVYEQRNLKELSLLMRRLNEIFPKNIQVLEFCLSIQLLAHMMPEAFSTARELDKLGALDRIKSENDVYYLRSITGWAAGTERSNQLDETECFIRKFNAPIFDEFAGSSVDVVCYLQHKFHLSIQKNIALHLREMGFAVVFSESEWVISALRPRILITSEALYGRLQPIRQLVPDCLIVNTRHGLGDKNHAAIGASHADRICVSSESIADLFADGYMIAREKIWVTGFSQMDDVFADSNSASAREINKGKTGKTVLFAPTYNLTLSAAFLLKDEVVKNIRGDDSKINIIIKPHPHLITKSPEIIEAWAREASAHEHVHLELDPTVNVMGLFSQADLMISDVSSVALAWFAVDKPLICIVDENVASESLHYASEGIEWQMLRYARTINDPAALSTAVVAMLNEEFASQNKRREFSDFLFGNLRDGRSSVRIAEKVRDVLQQATQ